LKSKSKKSKTNIKSSKSKSNLLSKATKVVKNIKAHKTGFDEDFNDPAMFQDFIDQLNEKERIKAEALKQ